MIAAAVEASVVVSTTVGELGAWADSLDGAAHAVISAQDAATASAAVKDERRRIVTLCH